MLPHSFLCPLLEVDSLGNLISDAHVRPVAVVEVDVSCDNLAGLPEGVEAGPVNAFYLYFSIDAFCHSIVCRGIILDMPLPRRIFTYASQQYCTPRSE